MYTCDVCGKEYDTLQKISVHAAAHRHDHVKLTDLQRQVILGSLLGDMSIGIPRDRMNPYIQVAHSINQVGYIMWKYDILKNLTKSSPKTYEQKCMLRSASYDQFFSAIRFNSMLLPCLHPIHKLVRGDGEKHVSESWLNEITDPIGVAVWYMDDGCLISKSNAVFALGSSSSEQCSVIQDWMLNKWDITTHVYIQPNTEYKILSISAKSNLCKFRDLVEPHVISSMRYKIDKLDYLS